MIAVSHHLHGVLLKMKWVNIDKSLRTVPSTQKVLQKWILLQLIFILTLSSLLPFLLPFPPSRKLESRQDKQLALGLFTGCTSTQKSSPDPPPVPTVGSRPPNAQISVPLVNLLLQLPSLSQKGISSRTDSSGMFLWAPSSCRQLPALTGPFIQLNKGGPEAGSTSYLPLSPRHEYQVVLKSPADSP